MSLTGSLEDLPLLDIIQIVSFSKKTGYLTIRTEAGEAAIVFHDGNVTSAFAWDSPPLDPRAATLPAGRRHSLIRNRIEMALEELVRLRDGQFSFALTDEPPKTVGARDVAAESLEVGINPQELLLDLARGIDEDRRDSSAALEASFAEPSEESFGDEAQPAPTPSQATPAAEEPAATALPEQGPAPPAMPPPPPPPPPAPPPVAPPSVAEAPREIRTILLVDDEEDVRRILAERFGQEGYQVAEAEDPDSAVKMGNRLGKEHVEFLLVTDLGMPTSGGSSFQGGFEVVKRLWKMNLQPPVLMMTESLSGALHARAKQMGISNFVFKPGLSKLDPKQFEADLKAFAGRIVADILPRMSRGAAPVRKPKPAAPGAPAAPPASAASAEDLSREFAILQRHLDELRRSVDPTQVSTLVMRVAREFFERGILFLVKNEEVRGLGGFGPAPKNESLNLLVRDVLIPLSEPSLFLDAVVGRKPWSGVAPDGKWSNYLLGKIGRFKSSAVALFPLLTHRETIALLFGDNPETGRDFGRLDALELFVNQAGVALENAFLQRKLQTMHKE